ncbi:unnamed protein product [Blepharisma stoltei]|uniref:Uncharacterized protein n=1 Tax=Blepharisma stoltei TaxID=1481888 RepID=A0AAU9K7A9_9CILI|nr:unnamed protein product [Blepharisma stoltei]
MLIDWIEIILGCIIVNLNYILQMKIENLYIDDLLMHESYIYFDRILVSFRIQKFLDISPELLLYQNLSI